MPTARYLYVSDQGRVYSSDDDPTVEDFEYARVGMLTILRLGDHHCYQAKGRWRPISLGKLVRCETDPANGEFHSDPDDSGDNSTNFRGGAGPARKPTDADGELHAVRSTPA